MVDHLLDDLERHGGDVAAGHGTLGHMDGVAHAGADDLGLDVGIVVENGHNVGDQIRAGLVDVVQPSQEGAHIGGAGPGGQQGLVGGEDQGAVGGDALGGQGLDGLQPLGGHGDLDDHVGGVDGVDLPALLHHGLGVLGGGLHLAGDGAVHNGGDLPEGLGVVAALFCDQGGVGGDAADDAHVVCLADLVHIRGINKEFHGKKLLSFLAFAAFSIHHFGPFVNRLFAPFSRAAAVSCDFV